MKFLEKHQWQECIDNFIVHSARPLIIILGPTASGKTGFSIEVAHYIHNLPHPSPPPRGEGTPLAPFGGKGSGVRGRLFIKGEGEGGSAEPGEAEIINADSRQLYKYLDIGTAKITDEEMEGIPHHLFDVLEPNVEVTIADYKKMATEAIDDCHKRGAVPILVGGSMLYISAVVDGLDPLPPVDPVIRERLEREWDEDDGWTLYDKLVEIDPVTAKSFEKQNKRYVVRAMELYEMTGKPPSTLKKTIPPPYDILQFGLHWSREALVKRIDQRAHIMLTSGWIEEVEGLLDKGFTAADPAMKSHGYKEIMQWLSSEERSTEELEKVITAKTRQYAKRQMTWWEPDDRIQWINASSL